MKRKVRLILINLLVGLVFIFSVDCLSFLVLVGNDFINEEKTVDFRTSLPNYKGIRWAKDHFIDAAKSQLNYKSFCGWRSQAQQSKTINIDSFGIRQTVHPYLLKNIRKSIVFLGGSAMWGMGANDANTIPSLFVNRLNKDTIEAFNFGDNGYTAYQSYQFLQLQLLSGLKPNLVISYDGINNIIPENKVMFEHPWESQIRALINSERTKKYGPYSLKSTRILIQKVKKRLGFSKKRNLDFESINIKESALELLESWLLLKKTCESEKIPFICMLQPNIYVGKPILNHLPIEILQTRPINSYHYYKTLLTLMETEKYASLKSNFIDLTVIFDNIPNIYIDFCHVSPQGNTLVVEALISYLENKDIFEK